MRVLASSARVMGTKTLILARVRSKTLDIFIVSPCFLGKDWEIGLLSKVSLHLHWQL